LLGFPASARIQEASFGVELKGWCLEIMKNIKAAVYWYFGEGILRIFNKYVLVIYNM